jgi:DnaK suppressor protein
MNGTEIGSLKSFLLAQKSAILNKSQEFKTQQLNTDGSVVDEAEVASRDFSMSVSIHLHERDRAALVQIERALAKIDAGIFGQCESCAQSIGSKRLEARPFAALCIDCMEEQEDPRNFLN